LIEYKEELKNEEKIKERETETNKNINSI